MTFPDISLRHLRTFVEVARLRNVTRAAERLNTVQPAVSRTVKELETRIGRPLFERTAHGFVLTDAGRRLYVHTEAALSLVAQGVADASGETRAEIVALGALPNITRRVLPGVVAEFKGLQPGITVRMLTGTNLDLLAKLRAGEVDVVIGRLSDPQTMTGLNFEHLLYEVMVFAAAPGHPLAGRTDLPVVEIDRFPVVVPQPGTIIRAELDKFLLAAGLAQFRDCVETTTFEFAKPYVLSTGAIVVLPQGAMAPELESGELVRLDVAGEAMRGPVGLSFRPNRQLSLATRILLRIFREHVARAVTGKPP